MSATIVGRNRFPWRCSKNMVAAWESTGFSVSTSALTLSLKGVSSSRHSANGSAIGGPRARSIVCASLFAGRPAVTSLRRRSMVGSVAYT